MSEVIFEKIDPYAESTGIDMSGEELARMSQDNGFTSEQLQAVLSVAEHLKEKKEQSAVATLLKMNRRPWRIRRRSGTSTSLVYTIAMSRNARDFHHRLRSTQGRA